MAKVLVVDDDDDVRNLVRHRAQRAGHRVLTAGSADEALALIAERGAPELVVLDVAMPGMDGLELLDTLRATDGLGDLPAIFLSARVQDADIAEGRARGALYLTKPFVANALLNAIDRLLEPTPSEVDGGW
ncbi:MAG: response regulator [Nitriliruptoraceae bacterium]